jgi:hypothetical protein
MNEDTRILISQIGNKEYNELSIENRVKIELSILELFFDERSKTSITFHIGAEKPIGINNEGVVYGCTDKIDVYNEHEEKKLLAEFNKLFEAKEETFGGTRSDFIKNELDELEFYNLPAIRNEHIILNMWKKYLTNKKNVNSITQKKITFESLFKDSANAQKVKDILKTHNYIDENNKWIGLTDETTELLAAYYVLKPILKLSKRSPQATIFYKEFGLLVGKDNTHNGEYITDRSLRKEPFNDNRTEFERIFASLLPKK